MVRQILLSLLILFAVILSTAAQSSNTSLYSLFDRSDKGTIMVHDFDVEEGGIKKDITWEVNASRYITKTDQKPYPQIGYINAYPNELGELFLKENVENMRVLAIRAAFNKKDYNYVNIIPYENSEKFAEQGVDGNQLPGIHFDYPIFNLGLYVWSNSRLYSLEAEFELSNGRRFIVSLGTLNYNGWKILSANIPASVYRASDVNSTNRSFIIKITKLTIWTNPKERVDDFVVYVDNIFARRLFTDLYYDGNKLGKKETIESIQWQEGSTGNNNNQTGQ